MRKFILFIYFLMMFVLCVVFTTCKTARIVAVYDGQNNEISVKQLVNMSFLNIESEKIYFSYGQNKKVILCSSDEKIEVISSDPSWCFANIDKTDDNTIIEIKVNGNNGKERTANVKVYVGKAKPAQIEIKQESGEPVPIEGIPILAWYGVKEHTVERYRELKECGIDYNLTLYMNVEQSSQALDAAKEAGVRIMIYSEGMAARLENIVERFMYHPATGGYYLRDEPNIDEFPHLGELVRRIQAIDNNHICYVIPFGGGFGGGEEYRNTYLKPFLNTVPVSILAFALYPIIEVDGVRTLVEWWYHYLEILSDEAHKRKMPFWAFALTTAHYWSAVTFPLLTLADIRLQVYSNLAYGAQGIQYFTYWTPSIDEGAFFHDGPIDYYTQQKTPTWYIVQQMNREIKALSSVFLGAQVIKVEHITITAEGENGRIYNGTTRFDFANRPTEAQIITKFTPANGTNGIVSFLKNGNRCYMVVINRNLEGEDNMSVTIEGGTGLQLIKKDGKAVPASSESSNRTITPGDALIYGWDIK